MKFFRNHTIRKLVAQTTVFEVAIGITLGAVFARLVSAVVANILMPPLVYFFNVRDVRLLRWEFTVYADQPPLIINFGNVLDNLLDFSLILFVLYWVARVILNIKRKGSTTLTRENNKHCPTCQMLIPKKAVKCPYCHSSFNIKGE